MSSGLYKSLPLESNATRMVRLLPDKEKNAEIECELFTYDLTEVEGGKHLYEALSYVWSGDQVGSAEQRKEMKLHGHTVAITANLHAALVNLRDYQLERVLWVDAICINQEDMDEKSKQIPLMRTIYAQADRVIVWLGEAFEHGDEALETLRDLAESKAMRGKGWDTELSELDREACVKLLQRKWFRRIWVLQEAGVARSIEIMCGSVQINGHIFCEGLIQLEIPSLIRLIHPVVYMIRGAQFRPRNAPRLRGSLYIGELIDMYRYHMASTSHDKVYALLGLAADDPNTAGLRPDYNLPWHQVFNNTTRYILSGEGSVETYPDKDVAIIQTKCWILGYIKHAGNIYESSRIRLIIRFNDSPESEIFKNAWGSDWMIQSSAESIESGDILCLLSGTSNPCIIRVSGDHFAIVNVAITPQKVDQNEIPDPETFREIESRQSPPFDITLTWTIPVSDTENKVDLKGPMKLIDIVPHYQEECWETEKRLIDLRVIVSGIAIQLIQERLFSSSSLEHLLAQLGPVISVSEQVVKAAVGYTGRAAPEMVKLIVQYQHNLPLTEEVIKVTARNMCLFGPEIMELLLKCQHNIPVTEEVIKAVAGNEGNFGTMIMELLFKYQNNISITEGVVKAAAGNKGAYGPEMLKLLFKYQNNLPITEEVIKAVVGNTGLFAREIIEVLFKYHNNIPVTQEVVKAVAGNKQFYAPEIMEMLWRYQNNVPVTEEVVRAVARNEGPYGKDIMRVIFKHQDGILINEEMVAAMGEDAGLDRCNIVMGMFFRRQEMITKSG
ncbi:Heterokaryon incompatibility protein HET [Aspergillus parasiticus SU-1]|uniref:Heterokaryon incompatibility protein HET n=1 Tax=Aspergillus parasiticus (strain ATCC 56775 / NRRL 5862 / SRRC 143 / SU-1) TaxID=1403190 RepID=A0A0F0I0R1_ASPPU|nr:Heterokaryon incompatibility protein HET [Aspergillus parasiticus SU-1]